MPRGRYGYLIDPLPGATLLTLALLRNSLFSIIDLVAPAADAANAEDGTRIDTTSIVLLPLLLVLRRLRGTNNTLAIQVNMRPFVFLLGLEESTVCSFLFATTAGPWRFANIIRTTSSCR